MGRSIEMFSTLVDSSSEFAREAVFEVYEFLRPRAQSCAAHYKTNQKYARVEIGKKVIITRMVEPYYGGYRVLLFPGARPDCIG